MKLFTPDRLKVASRDLTNLPLLEALAETKIPIILSTGMAGKKELDDALEIISRFHENISILHCVSQYPTHPDHLNLRTIDYLKKHYGKYTIGFSDHTIGIAAPVVAVGMGAEIIEKHVTIETGKVIEQSEGIPFASSESVFAHILCEIGKNRTYRPNSEDNFFLAFGGTFYPSRENRQI